MAVGVLVPVGLKSQLVVESRTCTYTNINKCGATSNQRKESPNETLHRVTSIHLQL